MSMKLPAIFDRYHPTFDEIVEKQEKSKDNDLGNKNMPPKKNLSRGSLSNWCDADVDAGSKTVG